MKNDELKNAFLTTKQRQIISLFFSALLIFISPFNPEHEDLSYTSTCCQIRPPIGIRPKSKPIKLTGSASHQKNYQTQRLSQIHRQFTPNPKVYNIQKHKVLSSTPSLLSPTSEMQKALECQSHFAQPYPQATMKWLTKENIAATYSPNTVVTSLGNGQYAVDGKYIDNLQDLLPAIDLTLRENYRHLGSSLNITVKGLDKGLSFAKIGLQETRLNTESVLLNEYDVSNMRIECESDDVARIVIPSKVQGLERMLKNEIVFSVKSDAADGVAKVIINMFDEYEYWDNERFLEKLEMVGISSDDIIEEYRSIIFAENSTVDYEYQLA